MTKGCKIWLWILLIGGGISTIVGFGTMYFSIGTGIYTVLAGAIQIAGVYILLYKQRKEGFYVLCIMNVINYIYNITHDINAFLAIIPVVVQLGLTCFFLSRGEHPLLDIPFFRDFNGGSNSTYMYNASARTGGTYVNDQDFRRPVIRNRFCTKCGLRIEEGAKFCTSCGALVEYEKPVYQMNRTSQISYGDRMNGNIFKVSQSMTAICLGVMLISIVGAIILFFTMSELPKYFYSEKRIFLFTCGVICAGEAVIFLIRAIQYRKIYLCINDHSISGIVMGIYFTREFEYSYSEIQEMQYALGTIFLLVNGRSIAFPLLENRETVKMILKEKLSRF